MDGYLTIYLSIMIPIVSLNCVEGIWIEDVDERTTAYDDDDEDDVDDVNRGRDERRRCR